jgi:hypothetical protein
MMEITRNGKTVVITGWRAWLVGAAVALVLAFVGLLIVLIFWGVAITLTAVLLVVVPLAIVFAIISALFGSRAR